jgi:hypothetical protein
VGDNHKALVLVLANKCDLSNVMTRAHNAPCHIFFFIFVLNNIGSFTASHVWDCSMDEGWICSEGDCGWTGPGGTWQPLHRAQMLSPHRTRSATTTQTPINWEGKGLMVV